MNFKILFGALLTLLGFGGLISASELFVIDSAGTYNINALIIYGVFGLIFFFAGIGLIRTIKDDS